MLADTQGKGVTVPRDEDITIWDCPQCGVGKLVRRENRNTGEKFLGCSKYPECRYTQKDEGTDAEEY
jgi:ssDNA-binding Zn-finger/Zn-ribbon topoisomerase 1